MSFALKLIFITALFYFFALLESSFLIPFTIYNVLPNLILCFIVAFLFIEKQRSIYDLFIILIGGFFLDTFSTSPFGVLTLDLLGLFLILKVLLTTIAQKNILSFILVFLVSILLYEFFYSVIYWIIGNPFYFKSIKIIAVEFLYNLPFGLFFYYCLPRINGKRLQAFVN